MDQPVKLDEIIENSPVQDVNKITEEWKEDNKAKGGKNGRPVTAVSKVLKQEKEEKIAEKKAAEAQEIEANRALKEAQREAAEKIKDLSFTSPKLAAWIEEFGKNGGDVTKAALAVGTYANHASAVAAGNAFLKRAIDLGILRYEMEKRGYTLGAMVGVLLDKMEKSRNLDGWDRAMKMAGYGDFTPGKNSGTPAVSINIVQDQAKDAEEFGFVEGEIVDADSNEN